MNRGVVLHARIVSGRGGGPEKTILNSARFLEASGYRSIPAYLHAPGDDGIADLQERAEAAGSPFVALPDAKPIDFGTLKALRELCEKERVTIWHGHDYKSNLYGLWLRRKLGFRLITTVHGWVKHTKKTPLYYAVDRWCIKRYSRVVCVSRDLEERCLEFGVPRERLTHIANAIDTEEFRRSGPAELSPLREDTAKGRLVLGAVGRLSKEKGFDHLIRALDELVREGLDLEVWIAGEGEEREPLLALARELGLADRVRLLGFQADTKGLFEAFDLYCLSSLREGLPNVVLEAMAMHVPVLATRSGGMDRFATDREEALLCAPGDPRELARGLRELVQDQELCSRLRETARARIERDFSFRKRMERMAELYDALGGSDPAR